MNFNGKWKTRHITVEINTVDGQHYSSLVRDAYGYVSYDDALNLVAQMALTLAKCRQDGYDAGYETPAYVKECADIFNNWGKAQDEELATPMTPLNIIGGEIAEMVLARGQQHLTPYGSIRALWLRRVFERNLPTPPTENDTPSISVMPRLSEGYVYLIRQQNGPWYKIGRSRTPSQRISRLEVVLPFTIEPICIIYSEDHVALEASLHERFAAKRGDGEWFALDATDVEYIKSLAVPE